MSFDWTTITRNWRFLLEGAGFTLSVTLVTVVLGILFGTLLALARLSDRPLLSRLATGYVLFFRSVPLVQVLLMVFLMLPILAHWLAGRRIPVGAELSAYAAFTLFEAAYYAEIIRAGIRSVSPGQRQAALALGLTEGETVRTIILPQAFRAVVPILLTQTIVLFQDVSLVYAIGATDFLGAAEKIVQNELRPVELYLFVAAAYLTVCLGLSRIVGTVQTALTRNLGQLGATP